MGPVLPRPLADSICSQDAWVQRNRAGFLDLVEPSALNCRLSARR